MAILKISETGGTAAQAIVHAGQGTTVGPSPSFLARYMEDHDPGSLTSWIAVYWKLHVVGSPQKTMVAKRQDIERFLRFFAATIGSDAIDDWTPAVSKAFATMLAHEVSAKTQKPLCATTVNRVMATQRTFARWVHKERPFLAEMPMAGVKPRPVDSPAWYGLTDRQVIRLKVACEQRQSFCTSKIQQPRLETAVFTGPGCVHHRPCVPGRLWHRHRRHRQQVAERCLHPKRGFERQPQGLKRSCRRRR